MICFVWSPKGFLTGSPTTPGSILVGYHFERNDLVLRQLHRWPFHANSTATGSS